MRHGAAKRRAALAALCVGLATAPLAAQERDRTVTNGPDIEDIAMTPITDLNLSRDEIPDVLLFAAANPYAVADTATCDQIAVGIAQLDALLGPDLDVKGAKTGIAVGKAAQSAVGSLIPFRGILREITGAADHQRKFEAAILAGAIRRGYLKGLGQQRECEYPARPAYVGQMAFGEAQDGEVSPRIEAESLVTPVEAAPAG